ncbi:hypothetical protein HDU67_003879 [Dinochytrium kinnereticum]|nr:hypothetical protein HDU67_003879 [Dinochytrium kinnereticum]
MTGAQVGVGFLATPYCGAGLKEVASGMGFPESLSFHDKMIRMALLEKGDARLRIAHNKAKAGKKRIEQLGRIAEPAEPVDRQDSDLGSLPEYKQMERRAEDLFPPEEAVAPPSFDPINQKMGVYSTPDQMTQTAGEALVFEYVNGTSETPVEPMEGGSSRISCKTIDSHIPHTSHPRSHTAKFGTFVASCELNETRWFKPHVFGGSGAVNWFRGGLDIESSKKDGIHCDAWVNTPIFAIKRLDNLNPYHIHEDLMNMFIAYASLDLDPSKLQVVILDERAPDGPFVSAFTDIFSTSSEFLDIWEIASLSPRDSTICFKRIVWAYHGQLSPLSLENSRETKCRQSPLLLAFRRFMLDRWRRAILAPKGVDPGSLPVDTRVSGLPVLPTTKFPYMDLSADLKHMPKDKGRNAKLEVAGNLQRGQPVDEHTPNRLSRRGGGHIDLDVKFIDDDDQYDDVNASPIVITYAIRKAVTMPEPLYEEDVEHHDHTDEREPILPQPSSNPQNSSDPVMIRKLLRRSGGSPKVSGQGYKLTRVLKNEKELIERIRRAVAFWTSPDPELPRRSAVNVRFRAIDFATLSVEDQVAVAQDTDVLIGPHGGSLIHLLYMRADPVAGLLELKPAQMKDKNFQYRNLAFQLGFRYDAVAIGQTYVHSLDLVVRRLRQIVVEVYRIRRNSMLASQASSPYTPPESNEKAW